MKQKRRQRRIRWSKKLLNIDGKAKNCSNLIDRSKQREKKKRNERNIPIKWTKNPHFFHFSFVFLFGSRRVVVVTKVDNGSEFAEIVIGRNLSMITFTWLGAHCCRQHSVFFLLLCRKLSINAMKKHWTDNVSPSHRFPLTLFECVMTIRRFLFGFYIFVVGVRQ